MGTGSRGRITMREIGRLADVSQSTVSLILNGKSEMVRICPETRDKVLTIAREHGYAPNLLARAMRTGDTGVIGILVSREAMRQIADNHGAVRGTLQLQAGFLLRDHRVMLEVVGEEDCRELRLPRPLSAGLVDTFILCGRVLLGGAAGQQDAQAILPPASGDIRAVHDGTVSGRVIAAIGDLHRAGARHVRLRRGR